MPGTRIVVLVGLPGSGKSTYLAERGLTGLSSDGIRRLLADDETDQSIHDRVFQTLRYLLRQRLAIERPATYIDATNLTPQERAPTSESAGPTDAGWKRSSSTCRWMSAAGGTRHATAWCRRRLWRRWRPSSCRRRPRKDSTRSRPSGRLPDDPRREPSLSLKTGEYRWTPGLRGVRMCSCRRP